MPKKILIVDDHHKTVQSIRKGMIENNIEVDVAHDGKTASQLAISGKYDVIISDVIMPEMTGIEFCQFIRHKGIQTPVLLLSALDSTDMKITGLNAGGDDFITKPFEFNELLARVRALARRNRASYLAENPNIILADLTVDPINKTVYRSDEKIELTPKEYNLLIFLLNNKGKVVKKEEIIKHVWEIDFDTGTNVVEVYINYLRNKIDKKYDKKLIQNRSGVGYFIKDND
ncbi:MAG: response regulator transcription factor [Saprospiraceae bacterium]|nr:response regulator transcription factor [Saprospiraceae bacterium]